MKHYVRFSAHAQIQLRDDVGVDQRRAFELLTYAGTRLQLIGDGWIRGGGIKARLTASPARSDELIVSTVCRLAPGDTAAGSSSHWCHFTLARQPGLPRLDDASEALARAKRAIAEKRQEGVLPAAPTPTHGTPEEDPLARAPAELRRFLVTPPAMGRDERLELARRTWQTLRLDRYGPVPNWSSEPESLRRVFAALFGSFTHDATNDTAAACELARVCVALGIDHGPRSKIWARTLYGAGLPTLKAEILADAAAFERLRHAQPQAVHWCSALRKLASAVSVSSPTDVVDLDRLRALLSSVDSGKALAEVVAWARTAMPTVQDAPLVAPESTAVDVPAPEHRPETPPALPDPASVSQMFEGPALPVLTPIDSPADAPATAAPLVETSTGISEPLMPDEQVRALVTTLIGYVDLPRARQQARACGLLGKADAAEAKRLMPDSEVSAELIADALNDRARHQCALATLAQLANAAIGADQVDPRTRTLLRRAQQALTDGEWERLERVAARLDDLWREGVRAHLPDALLFNHRSVAACLARDSARLLEALRGPHPVLDERPEAEEAGSPPSMVHSREPVGAAEHSPITAHDMPAVPAVPMSTPAMIVATTTLSDRLFAAWSTYYARVQKQLVVETTGHVRELYSALGRSQAEPFDCPADPDDVREAAERMVQQVRAQADALASALLAMERDHAERLSAMARSLGVAQDTLAPERLAPEIQNTVAALGSRVHAAVTRLESHESTLPLVRRTELEDLLARGFMEPLADTETLERIVNDVERARLDREAEQVLAAGSGVAHSDTSEATEPEGQELSFAAAGLLPDPAVTPFFRHFVEQLPRADPTPHHRPFLPVDADADAATLAPITAQQTPRDRANAAALVLLTFWGRQLISGGQTQRLLALERDAASIRAAGRGSVAVEAFGRAVLGLTLLSSERQRGTARVRRLTRDLLKSTTLDELTLRVRGLLAEDSSLPGLAHGIAGLLEHGFAGQVYWLASELTPAKVGQARRVLDALAIAMASLGRSRTRVERSTIFATLGMNARQIEFAEDYLEDCEGLPGTRRGTRPSRPGDRNEWPPLAIDFVDVLGDRFWERGRDRTPKASVNVSLYKPAEEGVSLVPGESAIDIPVLVRSSGTQGVGGVLLTIQPRKAETAFPSDASVEICVPWLSDVDLKETHADIAVVQMDVNPDEMAGDRVVQLLSRVAWIGGEQPSAELDVPIRLRATVPEFQPIIGYEGAPLDLDDKATFDASPRSVRDCLTALRDRLREGRRVHAVIHGRRRRGKSSISRTLERDAAIRKHFFVRSLSWDGPRMRSAAKAFGQLVELIARALLDAGLEVAAVKFDDLLSLEDISGRYLHWVTEAGSRATRPINVLLILDEFQKWIADLGTREERVAVLTALRHLTQGASGKLTTSFVLSGLQNLRRLVEESADFATAVDTFEIEALTREETNLYVRNRFPFDTDERTRLRLFRLSGGNPFVLNRLGGGLVGLLRDRRRRWCTVDDLDRLLESQATDGRLDAYLKYMICKDEEEAASTLAELSVLRAVAASLHQRRDYDGHVRVAEVETWLKEKGVAVDPGVPQEQLDLLVAQGILLCEAGTRYFLPGEWLCRQLATTTTMTLQPVTRRQNPDLVLGRYRKIARRGQGGEGRIWLARNEEDGGHEVALKIYPLDTVDLHTRIRRERDVLASIDHPCVVKCRGGNVDEQHGGVLVLDHVNGHTVEELLDQRPASAADILPGGALHAQVTMLHRITDAVAACHAVGVAHKDITPKNIMLVHAGGVWSPVLVDFGLAGLGEESATSTLGTMAYTAPEKRAGLRRTPAADVYSLGRVFTEMLTGSLPPLDWSPSKDEAPAEWARLPQKLRELLTRMLLDDPAARPTARDVTVLLAGCTAVDTWHALRGAAQVAFLEDRFEDAIAQVEKALGCVPVGEASSEFDQLLTEAVEIVLVSASAPVPWVDHIFDLWLRRAPVGSPLDDAAWSTLVDGTAKYAARMPSREQVASVWRTLVERTANQATSPSFAPLVAALARSGIAEQHARDQLYDLLIQYHAGNLFDGAALEQYCVRSAEVTRVQLGYDVALLWSDRARRLGIHSDEWKRQADGIRRALATTNQLDLTPPTCRNPRGAEVGEGEEGHLNVALIRAFATKVIARFPWICALRRVRKDRYAQVRRPTVLRIDNLPANLPPGTTAVPSNLIPIVLDDSFSAGNAIAPLRMNIVLEDGATAAQREKARELLAARAADLFDID